MFRAGALIILAVLLTAAAPIPLPVPKPAIATEQPGPQQAETAQPTPGTNQTEPIVAIPAPPIVALPTPNLNTAPAKKEGEHEPPWWLWWEYSGFWVALFTLVLTVSTIGLWVATKALVRDGARQHAITARAMAYVSGITLDLFGREATVMPDRRIQLQFTNSGGTPTKKATLRISSCCYPGNIPEDFEYGYTKWDSSEIKPQPIFLGPNAQVWGPPIDVTYSDFQSALIGSKKIFVWGCISYNDTLTVTPRRTRFCFRLEVMSRPDGSQLIAFPSFGPHNCTEEDEPAGYNWPT